MFGFRLFRHKPVEPVVSRLGAHFDAWAAHPDGGENYSFVRDSIIGHDPECDSIGYAWLPKRGGRTCLSDIRDCAYCDLTFSVDGLVTVGCSDGWHWACKCCKTKAEATNRCVPCAADPDED